MQLKEGEDEKTVVALKILCVCTWLVFYIRLVFEVPLWSHNGAVFKAEINFICYLEYKASSQKPPTTAVYLKNCHEEL